jgi:pimeloyl-ACP methyl ester carboxylesterase
MVQDLSLILDQLPGYFFLLGHSFGGVLAYEYVKRNPCDDRAADGRGCKGLILVSTPVSLNDSRENSKRLMREIAEEIDALDDMQTVKSEFRKRHECRVTPLPLPLQSALMNSPMLSRQRMPNEYQATGGSRDSGSTSNLKLIVPVLVMRGEYDFCPEESCRKWCMLFDAAQSTYVTLAGCSHYSMLENDSMFASVVTSFLQDLDSNNKA